MAKIEKFEEIEGWQIARQLTKEVYKISSDGSFAKNFALKNQIRSASISVMSFRGSKFKRPAQAVINPEP